MVSLLQKPHISKVNARHLLDDLAGSYTHSLEVTVIVEAVANALDAGARRISFLADQGRRTLTIQDDGSGMNAEEFERYHDLAESSKQRGAGIGFAGLGAKLAHNITTKVITETRSAGYHAASEWEWRGEDLQWKFVRRNALKAEGTKVEFHLNRRGLRLLERSFVEDTLVRYFGPLVDTELSAFYVWSAVYPEGVTFLIDNAPLDRRPLAVAASPVTSAYRDVKDQRGRRIGLALFALASGPLSEDMRGIAIATHGKVIRRDTLGLSPRSPDRIAGWIEVPGLVECLTLNKQDFVSQGSLGERYLRFRRAMQRTYSEWLAETGQNIDTQDARRAPQQLQREVARILRNVSELRFLFGATARRTAEAPSPYGADQATFLEGLQLSGSNGTTNGSGGDIPTVPGPEQGPVLVQDPDGEETARPRTRRVRSGPLIRIVSEPERRDMAWVEGDTVYVNAAHHAYLKAQREHQLRYHQRLVVLLALCQAAPVPEEHKLGILSRAISEWGE